MLDYKYEPAIRLSLVPFYPAYNSLSKRPLGAYVMYLEDVLASAATLLEATFDF